MRPYEPIPDVNGMLYDVLQRPIRHPLRGDLRTICRRGADRLQHPRPGVGSVQSDALRHSAGIRHETDGIRLLGFCRAVVVGFLVRMQLVTELSPKSRGIE